MCIQLKPLFSRHKGIGVQFTDDPIGHFDDMNILGFADLMRSLIDNSNWQIVISTHDEKIFRILQRKLSGEYYSSCFLKLPNGKGIKWIE